jgi:transposase
VIPIPGGARVWIATGRTDMRKGMSSLAMQVQQGFDRNPHAGDLYVFRAAAAICSRSCGMTGLACRSTPTNWLHTAALPSRSLHFAR